MKVSCQIRMTYVKLRSEPDVVDDQSEEVAGSWVMRMATKAFSIRTTIEVDSDENIIYKKKQIRFLCTFPTPAKINNTEDSVSRPFIGCSDTRAHAT